MQQIARNFEHYSSLFSEIGADPAGGMTRLLYSPEWVNAQQTLKTQMEQHGLKANFDEISNLFGRLEGSKYPDQVVMSGSHIDTVVNGGNLDGQYGILAALVAIQYLQETYGTPLRTLEVASFAEEEGSRFPYVFWGSKNMFALADKADVQNLKDAKGVSFTDAMQKAGFQFRADNSAPRNDIHAFVEIHIEQGKVLETLNKRLGVVTSIAGQKRYTITLKGEANHAGTTPMSYRRDTVYAFSRICCESIAKANAKGDPLVLTFGRVQPKPNTVNVVPGETIFSMDCRHTDSKVLHSFTREIEQDIQRIASEMGIEVDINLWMDEAPIPMDKALVQKVKNILEQKQIDYHVMHSGAGHDSQIIAPHAPTMMLFVPSIAGISHNPTEKTSLDD